MNGTVGEGVRRWAVLGGGTRLQALGEKALGEGEGEGDQVTR